MLSISCYVMFSAVTSHGFFVGPGTSAAAARAPGPVRDYSKISFAIDDLRNPSSISISPVPFIANSPVCRGAAPTGPVAVSLFNGQAFTVTQAFSLGAEHIGPCQIELFPASDPTQSVIITPNGTQCAKTKGDAECERPFNLVTNDMW
jgi:hypothetical protein